MDQHAASTDEKWASAKRLWGTVESFAVAAKLAETAAHIMQEIELEIAEVEAGQRCCSRALLARCG